MAEARRIPRQLDGEHGFIPAPLDSIYREHGPWLRTIVGKRFRVQQADADDIVQDAYLKLAQNPDKDVATPRAYLTRIALNLFRDGNRRRAVRASFAVSVCLAPDSTIASLAMSEQEASAELERLILALPEPLRDVFVLSRFRHMTNRDIAAHLGVSIKTVEWRMSRALAFCVDRLRD